MEHGKYQMECYCKSLLANQMLGNKLAHTFVTIVTLLLSSSSSSLLIAMTPSFRPQPIG